MLHKILMENRQELIQRTRVKVSARSAPQATAEELEHGVPLFLDQLAETLKQEATSAPFSPTAIDASAMLHGYELLKLGFTVGQVVHDYGDVCQSVTELALEQSLPITTSEFHTLNRCLDNAIAGAVTEWGRQREINISFEEAERLGALAHEQRNLLSSAMLALQLLKKGTVGIGGSTGIVLTRSLERLRAINDRSLAQVLLSARAQIQRRIVLAEFIEEEEVAAMMDASARGIHLTVVRPEDGLAVEADEKSLSLALVNLVQNALKFTRPSGNVSLRVRALEGRIVIEVEDECGGLAQGKAEEMLAPLNRDAVTRAKEGGGLRLGISIARKAVEANGGKLSVHNVPGRGCVFSIDLPAATSQHSSVGGQTH
jgi:signal transduction histidine kinase